MTKKLLLSFVIVLLLGAEAHAQTTHNVTSSGNNFTPSVINIQQGDIVDWNIAGMHNVVETELSEWTINGSTPKSGGFSTPFGGGIVTFPTAGTFYYVCSPHAGGGMKGQVIVSPVASIEQSSFLEKGIEVYPNPASDVFTVKVRSTEPSNYHIRVIDMIGKNIAKLEQQGSINAGVSYISSSATDLENGIYFVELQLNGQKSVKRLIVKH